MTPIPATHLLRDDHKRLIGLFRQCEAIDQRTEEFKRGVIQEIYMELEVHSEVEQQIFYPALLSALTSTERGRRSPLNAATVDQGVRDHREIEERVQQLRLTAVEDENFDGLFEELEELVDAHLVEEDRVLLPEADEILADELQDLGAKMQTLRDELLAQPQYELSRAEVVQNPHGGEQMRKAAG